MEIIRSGKLASQARVMSYRFALASDSLRALRAVSGVGAPLEEATQVE